MSNPPWPVTRSDRQVTPPATGQGGAGPDPQTIVTQFYGGSVDQAQPPFRLNAPGSHAGSFLLWNDPVTLNPVNAPWRRILAAHWNVTTSAAVKKRSPVITYTDNQHLLFTQGGSAVIPAGVTLDISAAIGANGADNMSATGGGAAIAMALPDLWLPPGTVFGAGLQNFDLADICNYAYLLVQEAGPILTEYNQASPVYIYGEQPAVASTL